MIYYQSFDERLPQFSKGPPSIGGKEQSSMAKVLSSGDLGFFGPDPLFGLSRFLTFTTFLCWLFFILILYLDSLTTLLWICWTYY